MVNELQKSGRNGLYPAGLNAVLRSPVQPPAQAPEYAPEDMRSLVKNAFCTMDYRVVPSKTSPMTCSRGIGLGAVDIFRHEGVGKRVGSRDPVHIRNHWVDDFVISMPLDARVTTSQGGHVAKLEPGGFVFLSTSRPFDASLTGIHPHAAFSAFLVRISGPLLRQQAPLLDNYCGLPLQIETGAGKIMQALFDLALDEGPRLSRVQLSRFNDMLLDAVTNVAIEIPDIAGYQPQRQPARDRLREDAIAYIHCHLSDPDLGVNQIAQHCRVSTRYLQAAFASASITVGDFIREARLQACRTALLTPGLRQTSIIDIALRWGFSDAPYFSRAYKGRFGKSPSSERH